MYLINGYRLDGELTNDNSGYAKWGFAEKEGKRYFIKEFLSPIYPIDETVLSKKQIEKKREICAEFFEKKKRFYNMLNMCSTGNIVVVSDFFRFGSRYYITTERIYAYPIDPSDIAAMNDEQKLLVMKIILYCFKSLHEHSIVHGDIKPDNILFKKTEKGMFTAKVIDFDSSFLESEPPCGDDIQGDMIYLAPESFLAIAGEESVPTRKIDVFALGVLFHQYLSGELPGFDKSKYHYTFEAVLDESEIKISDKLDGRIAGLIRRMLSRDPSKRPNVTDIFNELNAKDDKSADKPPTDTPRIKSTIRKSAEDIKSHGDKSAFFRPAGDL